MSISTANDGLCDACWLSLGVITGPRCGRCGCPSTGTGVICPNCLEKGFVFQRFHTLATFNDPVQRLVYMLNYGGKPLWEG